VEGTSYQSYHTPIGRAPREREEKKEERIYWFISRDWNRIKCKAKKGKGGEESCETLVALALLKSKQTITEGESGHVMPFQTGGGL